MQDSYHTRGYVAVVKRPVVISDPEGVSRLCIHPALSSADQNEQVSLHNVIRDDVTASIGHCWWMELWRKHTTENSLPKIATAMAPQLLQYTQYSRICTTSDTENIDGRYAIG